MFNHQLLSLLIWLPIMGGIIVLATGNNDRHRNLTRWLALVFALLTLALCVPLYLGFNPDQWQMQFVESHRWLPALGIQYALGVDGISVLFILLCCFTNVVIILASWHSISTKVSQFMAIFLISTGLMNGAFASTDAMIFYIFFEAILVPMYLGIGIWGGARKTYAAYKLFLYTFLGSIFMLVAFLYLYSKTGSFSIAGFQQIMHLSTFEENWLFLAFFIAFAVKTPLWPLHTWLPDAHTEAPSGGSVVLAALMLKLGAYGFIRFSLPILPDISQSMDWFIIILSLVSIIYIGIACVVQKDMKRLIAYSSVSHMGLVIMGLFIIFMIVGQTHGHDYMHQEDAALSIQGAIFQMIAHAFATGALFIGIGYLYDRFGSRLIQDYRGIAHAMPVFAAFYMLFAMANVGLPGTAGFPGEFMIIIAAFRANIWIALAAGLTLIIAPAYTLWMYKRVLFGEVKNQAIASAKDIKGLELLVLILLAIPVIVLGIYPEFILHLSHATSTHFVEHVMSRIPAGTY